MCDLAVFVTIGTHLHSLLKWSYKAPWSRKLISIPLEQVALWLWSQHFQIPSLLHSSSCSLSPSLLAFITNTSWKPLQIAVCTVLEPNYHSPPAYIVVGELGHTLQNMYRNTSEPKWHTQKHLHKQTHCKKDSDVKAASGQLAQAIQTDHMEGGREAPAGGKILYLIYAHFLYHQLLCKVFKGRD